MRPGARITAAIEVLEDVLGRHRPVGEALSDWGKAHRIAGSGDRAAIGNLVYDALRRRASIAWAFDADAPRALAIGAAGEALALSAEAVAQACDGSQHAPAPLSEVETAALSRPLAEAPAHVQANVPEWLWPSFVATFGDNAIAEGQRLAMRAPTDIRVNTLKATREKVAKSLASFGVEETALSPLGLRVRPPQGPGRTPNLQAEAAFEAGWFEIQDEGSQIASLMAGAGPRLQVLDLCAGGGGKTLAMAANMQNTGQIFAYDSDRHRLKPIFQRVKRAGVRNVQVLKAGDTTALEAMGPRFDLVLVDAPCTGTGVWRRRPEAKWRLREHSIGHRQDEQREVLGRAAGLVKPGGVLVYVTCSILAEENTGQVAWATETFPDLAVEPTASVWERTLTTTPPPSADGRSDTLLMTPNRHDTDGFFVSVLRKRAA
ncbi:MAG: RsmB/NOP family class I SAM-dependent RNA methyltransferase [Hyphomicrobiaceae bacterium]